VRTIVVWKHNPFASLLIFLTKRCVRTIVVWKLPNSVVSSAKSKPLRENHSGMETIFPLYLFDFISSCCVRTIVVWKQISKPSLLLIPYQLRENHSGMETEFLLR